MASDSLSQRKAQLDKEEREHLEDVVTEMRERVEDNVEFQLTQKGLDDEPADFDELDEDTRTLAEAIDLEEVDGHTWDEAFEQYVTGVGYTIVNRLAALRCMEVRDFIDEEVTVFKENGLTPAAETLVHEEFLLEDEAIIQAYHDACDRLAEEIEILFNRDSAYSQVDPDDDTFEELCGMLDEIPDEIWRADDVLGWVYEYYNATQLSDVRERMRTGQFNAADVAVANQFYTPHWVARLLTDNAVGKPYLRAQKELTQCFDQQSELTPTHRNERDPEFSSTPSVSKLCTYLIQSEKDGVEMDQHPSDIQVLDPTCGSGHFLLYAFDVLERIWRRSTDVQPSVIPEKILNHNLYGLDIDLRACQLAAFNIYLKARRRAELEGADSFQMPSIGIVCADSQISDIDRAYETIETLEAANEDFADALETVLDDFRTKEGLGSLLDVKGTLEAETTGDQTELSHWTATIPSLSDWIEKLHQEVEAEESTRFFYQNLQSFLRVSQLLTKDYDAILMNPPYGGHRRMPKQVKEYVQDHYEFGPEYYANFLEQSERLLKPNGQIGMLVPRSFMYKESFTNLRQELIKDGGAFDFDFLVEFGNGILDNATVRTVGTVLTKREEPKENGEFMQLSDVEPGEKEDTFTQVISNDPNQQWRRYSVQIDEFQKIPGGMLTYWAPPELRDLYTNNTVLDADQANLNKYEVGSAKKGIDTGKNARFVRYVWECDSGNDDWSPYAKGGRRSWFYYPEIFQVFWDDGKEIRRYSGSTIRNEEYIGQSAITWPMIKESGHRFASFHGGVSDNVGPCFYPKEESITYLVGMLNSTAYTGLMLAQTPERNWFLSDIAILPYFDMATEGRDRLEQLTNEVTNLVEEFEAFTPHSEAYAQTLKEYDDFNDFTVKRADTINRLLDQMREKKSAIDELIVQELGISDVVLDQIEKEVEIRYGDYDHIPYSEEDISTIDKSFCNRLLSYLLRTAVTHSDDGILEITSGVKEGTALYESLISQIENLFSSPPDLVLQQIDSHLGTRTAESTPYPNIDQWVRTEFFENHCSNFKNAPIFWELTTYRLVSNAIGEGFSCLIDYREVGPSLFDRLNNQYLEPRKVELRERRSAADRRQSDQSLPTSDQAEAAENYERYVNHLQQIEQFEQILQDINGLSPRDWSENDQHRATKLKSKVGRFRKQTQNRLDALDQLYELETDEWFKDVFSPTFYQTVSDNRDEWIGALEDLEVACAVYSRPKTEPVEAHRYDLFPYFDDIAGSDHYSSNGILFMTYYFEREGAKYLDEKGQPLENLQSETAELLATLAASLEDYKRLAEEIKEDCNNLQKSIPTDWKVRAVSEITTAGYQPNRKHGVEINIKPLVEAEIVPEIVDNQVI